MNRPEPSEYMPYHETYISLVETGEILPALEAQPSVPLLQTFTDAESLVVPAPGKWTLRKSLGHMIDTERIFAYRALRIARKDATPLAGFDQDPYVAAAHANDIPWSDLLEEFALVRRANIFMFRGFDAEGWTRRGEANGHPITVRALAYLIAGHELHHRNLVRDRYSANISTAMAPSVMS